MSRDQRKYPLLDVVIPLSEIGKYPRSVTQSGYVIRRIPNHINADAKCYVYEHRLVMATILGRNLKSAELVHHIDSNKLNNTPQNLALANSVIEHKAQHRIGRTKNTRLPGEINPVIHCACGCGKVFLKYDDSGRERKYTSGHNRKNTGRRNSSEIITCACGCGTRIRKYDKYSRERKFVSGHNLNRRGELNVRAASITH